MHDGEYEEDFNGLLKVAAALFSVPFASLNFSTATPSSTTPPAGRPSIAPPKVDFSFSSRSLRKVNPSCRQRPGEIPSGLQACTLFPREKHPLLAVAQLSFDDFHIGTLQIWTLSRAISPPKIAACSRLCQTDHEPPDPTYRFYQMRKAMLFTSRSSITCLIPLHPPQERPGEFTFVKLSANSWAKTTTRSSAKPISISPPELAQNIAWTMKTS